MDRKNYMQELERQLRVNHVSEIDVILEEYSEHFDFKLADGYSEEEIAARLGTPKDIASQFAQEAGAPRGGKVVTAVGLAFADIFAGMTFVILFAWVLVLGAFALCCLAIGVCLVTKLNIAALIPYVPYGGAVILGAGLFAVTVLAGIGTAYCYLYSAHLVKMYASWHRRTLAGGIQTSPPMSNFPRFSPAAARRLRTVTMLSLIASGVLIVTGMIVLFIAAGFKEPWHHWGWFVS